jgi:tRNA 2-(methylsulfanyl)-N6-isopentenyladenosine37 hydroxylase
VGDAAGARVIVSATGPGWIDVALADVAALLIDHAHCERKAATAALSLVAHYSDSPRLVRWLSALAIEELGHFRAVAARVRARGLVLARDRGDPYVQALQQSVRAGEPQRRTDRLLVAGLIEARSHERLQLLAGALPESDARFYAQLARAEEGHAQLFLQLAREAGGRSQADERLAVLAREEAAIVAKLPLAPRIH